ncbi:MAG: PEGA domain-containing protein [Paludibacter sp.]|nr:PEGA domain-containing protein [Paludibacter sp.]
MKKRIHSIPVFLSLALLGAGCSSTTMIQSNPTKAKVYLDGTLVGETPYRHTDARIVGSSMTVRLEKDGYNPLMSTITKDEEINVEAVVGGIFVAVPLLWCMQYQPEHMYELKPVIVEEEVKPAIPKIQHNSWNKADRLRELKQLLDEKILTPEEYEKEKAKVLEGK